MRSTKRAGAAGMLALTLMLTAAPAAPRAGETGRALDEGRAIATELGKDSSALTYWARAADGWRVVTTVDTVSDPGGAAESHAVVRFSAALRPGESQMISVPARAGTPAPALRIRRVGDRIEVARIAGAVD